MVGDESRKDDEDIEQQISDEDLSELVEHLQGEEEASLESIMESTQSFQAWLAGHPALRQMVIVDTIGEIGPNILMALRVLLGLDKPKD